MKCFYPKCDSKNVYRIKGFFYCKEHARRMELANTPLSKLKASRRSGEAS